MKTKFLYLAAIALLVSFTACEKKAPYDLQSPDDNPLILVPYEGDNGTAVNVSVTNPDPYVDSVIVVPSAYTTVNWYLDNVLVHTGNKINQCFPTGTYDLLIEAVTNAGKRTTRSGKLTVSPAATDPYVSTRVLAAGVAMTIEGKNLDQVAKVLLARDFYGKDTVCSLVPTNVEASKAEVTLPEMADGTYYICLLNSEGVIFGSDKITVKNAPMALGGFMSFSAGATWEITGVNLSNVASVKVGDETITALTVTNTSVTLTAPNLPEGEYTLSMKNADGSDVLFYTSTGMETEVKVRSSAPGETTIWEGATDLNWGDVNVRIETAKMAVVPEGATVRVYYNTNLETEYSALRITTAWWGDPPSLETDLVLQFDARTQPSPLVFTYDSRCKALVNEREAMLIVGFGVTVTQVTYQ